MTDDGIAAAAAAALAEAKVVDPSFDGAAPEEAATAERTTAAAAIAAAIAAASSSNDRPLFCRYCGSRFLSANAASGSKTDGRCRDHLRAILKGGSVPASASSSGGEGEDEAKEDISISEHFWTVSDMWDFDNFGQTRALGGSGAAGEVGLGEGPSAVGDEPSSTSSPPGPGPGPGPGPETVYVVCSDCERGPVGLRWTSADPYLISRDLVSHTRPEMAEGARDGALPPGMSEDFLRGLIAQKERQEQEEEQRRQQQQQQQQNEEEVEVQVKE